MSSEARTIRPFTGLELFDQALSKLRLHFGKDICNSDESIHSDLQAHEFQLRPVQIEWAEDSSKFHSFKNELIKGVNQLEIDSSVVSLVVVAETAYLKEVDILINHQLSKIESLDRVVHLASSDNRPDPFRAWRHGFRVKTLILLNQDIQPQPLRPWRLGTWLAQAKFRVKTTDSSRRLYRPLPLDDEAREKLNLQANTAQFVNLGDHDPLEPYEEQAEEPEFYIDADLLSELNASSAASASSKAIQLSLALHFITSVVYRASQLLSTSKLPLIEDLSGSLTARIIQLCVGSAQNKEAMQSMLRDLKRRPERVVAMAEDRLKNRSALIKNVKGTD